MSRQLSRVLLVMLLLGAASRNNRIPAAPPTSEPPSGNQPHLTTQLGHTLSIYSAALSPDGRWAVTGGVDKDAVLWDTTSGKEILRLGGHSNWVAAVAFAPDSTRVLTSSFGDGAVLLWNIRSGKEVLRLKGHDKGVTSVVFSPDGKKALTGSVDTTARVWDAQTGKEVLRLKGHDEQITSVAFSLDGKKAVTSSFDKTARVWDVQTGKELRCLQGHEKVVSDIAFTPDGKRVLTGSTDGSARVWDAQTGKELLRLQPPNHEGYRYEIHCVALSPDGKRALTGGIGFPPDSTKGIARVPDTTARLWDAQTGKELFRLQGHTARVNTACFAADGKRILTCSFDATARLWDADSGKESRRLQGRAETVDFVTLSPDGKRILTGNGGGRAGAYEWDDALVPPGLPTRRELIGSYGTKTGARLWDAQRGEELFPLRTEAWVVTASFSPDGKQVITGGTNKAPRIWSTQTGKELLHLRGHEKPINGVAFSPDGKKVISGGFDLTARVWDVQTGKELHRLLGHEKLIQGVAFSPDSKRVLTGSWDKTARVWDAHTGKELLRLQGHSERVGPVAFSPDKKHLLTGSGDHTARIWDAVTGKETRRLEGHTQEVHAVAYSPDSKWVLTGSTDHTARLWNATTGKEVFRLEGHTEWVYSVAFTPDGKRAITSSWDRSCRVWDLATGKELCRLISFREGTWAVVDPEGRYDASKGGDIKGLHWVVGLEAIDLTQLKDRYYDPGLLAKHLGWNREPLREVAEFKNVKLYPAVGVARPDPKRAQFDVTLTNQGGGIGRVEVIINGKEVTDDARPRGANAGATKLNLKLDLSADPRLLPGRTNKIEVRAYNAEGYLVSRGAEYDFEAAGTASAAVNPTLHAVVVGVSKYRGEKLNLRYAAKDAEDFATAIRLAATGLFGAAQVNLTLLNTADGPSRPSRANITKALESLKATKPGDIVVVYLAGHGVTQGGQDGDWFYLTADAQSADLKDPEIQKQMSLSSKELTDLLKVVPARKQVLVLDTCHAGRVVEKLSGQRDVPASQVRALQRVKDRTGMHVLAGCAADSVSYEASRYGQGMLTYSLLEGMRGAKLRESEYVDIVELFHYAADRVPELARDIGGVQRPTIASPRGGSFDIGRLTAEDRKKVPLQSVKPVLLRSSFQEEARALDGLALSRRVDTQLENASAAPRGAKLVFVPASEFTGGILTAGRYKVEGDKATVSVTLFKEDKELAKFTVEGKATQPDELAAKIAAEVEKRLASAAR